MKFICWLISLGMCLALLSCASTQQRNQMVDAVPQWLGGEPTDVPPRMGTPEYDAWMAKRAEEAARPKGKK
jgi:hypothetical protein